MATAISSTFVQYTYMKAVILAGGLVASLVKETHFNLKAISEVVGKPHPQDLSYFGINELVSAAAS